ncbi:adhesion G protein-coupled receptor L3-like isoform X1 [Mya arenaria]|uniref:adhesion G protein-coupled receptor L3-like isoform X1 n=1 Tax=Mya arenaria TaxID=6604 RepID=UPI0022E5C3CF|nr:adhesion G protein-coupled receptor L3-like isoform X1 [Mya arenaria]XP_052762779.1 adhesion G protein-coupled receptor L3-like isoform X1 [Mya arenaria]
MCSTSIFLVFVITDYLISSSIIGISVANGQDGNIDVDHFGDLISTLEPTFSDDTKVRLVDGPTNYEGRVEVYINGRWGTICDDHFNADAASVVCRMLHINVTDATVIPEGFYGEGNGTIWLDDVRCLGNESSIADCAHGELGRTDCKHYEDVGVMCATDAICRAADWRDYVGVKGNRSHPQFACLIGNPECYNDSACRLPNINYVSHVQYVGCGEYAVVICDSGFVASSMVFDCLDDDAWANVNCIEEGNEKDNGSVNATSANEDITADTVVHDTGPITCAASKENGVEWPEALDGQISRYRCSEGYQGDIYRRCQQGKYLNPVNNCTRKAIQDLYVQVFNGSLNATDALLKLNQETNSLTTANENMPTVGDLQNVNQILDKVIEDIKINSATIENDTDSFFEVANNLLNGNATSSWKSLINDKGVGADSVINTIDHFITKVVNFSNGDWNKTFDKSNLFIEIGQVDKCVNISFPSAAASTTDQIVVGCGQDIGKKVFSGSLFKSISGMLPTSSNDIDSLDRSINGPVLSFSFYGHHIKTENVRMSFHLLNNSLTNPFCSFWETNRSGKSLWSTDGCTLEQFDRERGTVSCQCNHLTNFAVLMSPASPSETETFHHRRLGVLSIVGCSISIIGLFLTITTYVYFWRVVRTPRSALLVNLCTVLLLAYVVFLAGVNSTSQHAMCTSIAVLLHYMFLVALFLMLSEGCIIAQMVLRPHDKRNALHALLGISYGIPLIVVIISAASSKLKGYGNDKFCWLSIDLGLFWAFAGPALAIVFTNTIITVAVIKRMFGTSALSKRGDADKIKTGLRSVCVLLPVFGITWFFGVFAVNRETVVFQYLFVIFNSLQGVLIFVVQCILDRKVQEVFKARRARWHAPEVSITATEMKSKSSAVPNQA